MTSAEYTARRESILARIAGPKSITKGDSGLVNRDAADAERALKLLDYEFARSQGTSTGRIGRLYVSGEGK